MAGEVCDIGGEGAPRGGALMGRGGGGRGRGLDGVRTWEMARWRDGEIGR